MKKRILLVFLPLLLASCSTSAMVDNIINSYYQAPPSPEELNVDLNSPDLLSGRMKGQSSPVSGMTRTVTIDSEIELQYRNIPLTGYYRYSYGSNIVLTEEDQEFLLSIGENDLRFTKRKTTITTPEIKLWEQIDQIKNNHSLAPVPIEETTVTHISAIYKGLELRGQVGVYNSETQSAGFIAVLNGEEITGIVDYESGIIDIRYGDRSISGTIQTDDSCVTKYALDFMGKELSGVTIGYMRSEDGVISFYNDFYLILEDFSEEDLALFFIVSILIPQQ